MRGTAQEIRYPGEQQECHQRLQPGIDEAHDLADTRDGQEHFRHARNDLIEHGSASEAGEKSASLPGPTVEVGLCHPSDFQARYMGQK